MKITFTIPGEPRGKGRPRFSGGRAYTDEKTKAYEELIAWHYRKACGGFQFAPECFLRVDICAVMPIPQSASRGRRAAMESGQICPSRKPDLDNIIKVILDALNTVAYKDDARIVEISARKEYGHEPCVEVVMEGVA